MRSTRPLPGTAPQGPPLVPGRPEPSVQGSVQGLGQSSAQNSLQDFEMSSAMADFAMKYFRSVYKGLSL